VEEKVAAAAVGAKAAEVGPAQRAARLEAADRMLRQAENKSKNQILWLIAGAAMNAAPVHFQRTCEIQPSARTLELHKIPCGLRCSPICMAIGK
jgi:hypothetical protein